MEIAAFQRMLDAAQQVLPLGVGASARTNAAMGFPLYIERGDGARLYGVDGREYLDFNMSHGATFLGHNHPSTRAAILKALDIGAVCAYETEYHHALAGAIVETVPCAESVRYVNSGTEATMVALRMARKYTGKNKIVKFEGHFHGLHEFVMFNARASTDAYTAEGYLEPRIDSAGVPEGMKDYVIVLPWNDIESVKTALERDGDDIAAVIMEPINYNAGGLVASPEYMRQVRELTAATHIPLIYDEVLSGFRTGPGCAQAYYGVTPDLCVLAKAIANGIPLAVVAGNKAIMETVGEGVAHSGTYTGHLFAIMAGLATLEEIHRPGFYDHLYAVGNKLYTTLQEGFDRYGVPAWVQGVGARFGIFFGTREPVNSLRNVVDFDAETATRFYQGCFTEGLYFHTYSRTRAGQMGYSAAHTLADIDLVAEKIDRVLRQMTA